MLLRDCKILLSHFDFMTFDLCSRAAAVWTTSWISNMVIEFTNPGDRWPLRLSQAALSDTDVSSRLDTEHHQSGIHSMLIDDLVTFKSGIFYQLGVFSHEFKESFFSKCLSGIKAGKGGGSDRRRINPVKLSNQFKHERWAPVPMPCSHREPLLNEAYWEPVGRPLSALPRSQAGREGEPGSLRTVISLRLPSSGPPSPAAVSARINTAGPISTCTSPTSLISTETLSLHLSHTEI